MTVTLHALWMLCALGTVVFAAAAARRRGQLAWMAAGYVAFLVLAGGRPPDTDVAGLMAAAGAALYLARPGHGWLAAALGGATAGVMGGVFEVLGLPLGAAVGASGLAAGATVWLTRRRPQFAPAPLRDEALLVIGGLGLAVAVLPRVLDGWQAAASLNLRDEPVRTAVPVWTSAVLLSSIALGAAHSVWRRR